MSCSIIKRHLNTLQQTKLETISFVPGEGLCLDVEAMKKRVGRHKAGVDTPERVEKDKMKGIIMGV